MARSEVVFLKLGGSLLTDKSGVEALRPTILGRLADEIRQARLKCPELQLVLGHGSGSYGHVAAARYGTRNGVKSSEDWAGLADVGAAAARLNAEVRAALLVAGVPALTLQPSASALCEGGQLVALSTRPVKSAIRAGLVPLLYGDVAFDDILGGTIISTEEILSFLASDLKPSRLLLAGITDGVLDSQGNVIRFITNANLQDVRRDLGASHGTDVTGGMASKVLGMMELVTKHPGLSVRIFSGLNEGAVEKALLDDDQSFGTIIRARE